MFTAPDDEIETGNGGFNAPDDEIEDKGFLSNLSENVGQTFKGFSRMGQGIVDLPSDIYQTGKGLINGQDFGETPIGQDISTVSNVVGQMVPRIVSDPRQGGKWRLEPGALYRQYEEIAAQPFKSLPGKIGEAFKNEFPENPFNKKPLDTALAVAPVLGKIAPLVREIPLVDEALNATSQGVRKNLVAPLARRTLGKFPSKNPQMIEQANQAGLTAIDKGIIKNPITNPLSSGPKSMLGRTIKASDQIGEEIGKFLKGQNEGLDVNKALNELESLKSQFPDDPMIARKIDSTKEIINRTAGIRKETAGFKEIDLGNDIPSSKSIPNQTTINLGQKENIIANDPYTGTPTNQSNYIAGDNSGRVVVGGNQFKGFVKDQTAPKMGTPGKSIIGTGESANKTPILGVYGKESPKMEFSKANKLKGYLQGKVNYKTDAATQNVGKSIARNFKESIDNQLEELSNKFGSQSENASFIKNKKEYSSLSRIEDALNDRVSRESRNMPLSLPSIGIGLTELLHGGGLKGVIAALGSEWTRRYGSATAATMLNDFSKVINTRNIPSISPIVGGIPGVVKSLNEAEAREYLKKAGGDRNKAREMAAKDGHTWKGKK